MEDLKPQDLRFHCRTCLKKYEDVKHEIKQLTNSFTDLLNICIGSNNFGNLYIDGICECCYKTIENFEEFRNTCKQSNKFLENILITGSSDLIDAKDNQLMSDNEQLEDPLNYSKPDSVVEQSASKILERMPVKQELFEPDTVNTEVAIADVFFSTADNPTEFICKYGCGKTFKRAATLKAHYRIKHEKTLKKISKEMNESIKKDAYTDSDIDKNEDEDWIMSETENDKNQDDNKKFRCEICNKKFTTKSTLRIHNRLHGDKLPFQCDKCERSFNKKIRLKRHIAEFHGDKPLSIVCKFGCDKIFNRYHHADEHYRKHRLNLLDEKKRLSYPSEKRKKTTTKPRASQDSFVCEDCGKVFLNLSTLRLHSYKHRPIEERPFQCEQCNKGFIIKRSYDEHLIRHAGIQQFQCTICGAKKTTKRELRSHMNCHTKEKQVKCTLCSKLFSDPKTMKSHIERVHQGLKKYNCRYCDKCFSKCDIRNRHELEHGAQRPLKCQYCDETFFLLSKLNAHTKTHNVLLGFGDGRSLANTDVFNQTWNNNA